MNAQATRKLAQEILGVEADGEFGRKTRAAFAKADAAIVVKLQTLLGITTNGRDGIRGPQTNAMFDQLADSPDDAQWPPDSRVMVTVGKSIDSTALHGALNGEERAATFGGPFKWRRKPEPGNPENIVIAGDWEEENIVSVEVPQLAKIPGNNFRRMGWNKRAVRQLVALWAAWEAAGLLPLVLSYEGSFVPRLIRGSTVSLSNHAYGSAFDINYAWNQLGKVPAKRGTRGSVRELVPIAHEHGFFWGGNFSRLDGMHFEVCKILP